MGPRPTATRAAARLERLVQLPLRLGRLKSEAALHAAIVAEATRLLRPQRVLLVLQADRQASHIAASKLPAGEDAAALCRAVTPWLDEALASGACRLRHGPDGAAPTDQRSCLVAPLQAPQGPLGCLYADTEGQHGRFEAADRDLLATLASQAAVALANLRTNVGLERKVGERTAEAHAAQGRAEQRAAELAIINSIQHGIAGSLDFQGIVELVGERLREVLHSDNISIRWFDPATGLLHLPYAIELGQRLHVPPSSTGEGSSWSRVRATRRPLVLTGPEVHAMPGTATALAEAYVPIIAGDQVLGLVVMEDHTRADAFGEAEIRLLSTVATAMGVALQSALRFA